MKHIVLIKKHILPFILIAAVIMTAVPLSMNLSTASADDSSLSIQCNGEEISSLLLEYDEKEELTAVGLSDTAEYQWQIFVPDESIWVDIEDKTENTCEVSAALVENVILDDSKTEIRCTAENSGVSYTSGVVEVTLNASEEGEITEDYGVMATAEGDTDTETTVRSDKVKITIDYLLGESEAEALKAGTRILESYTATLQKGSSFTATVKSPNYVGYAPYVMKDEKDTKADDVTLSYTNLSSNQTVTVYYKAAEVSYFVHYYLQNISDDLYTESSMSDKKSAKTGTYPKADVEVAIEGFTSLFHEPDVVAADGSTEFYCYYDRNYYLYQFDNNGGYGVEPVYARYQTNLVIGAPVHEGYEFVGWDLWEDSDKDEVVDEGEYDGEADSLDKTVGLENKTYKAI